MSDYRQKQNLLNTLVVQFNVEIAKAHPDFPRLSFLSEQIGNVEGNKGDETDYLIRSRAGNVSRDIMIRTEQALKALDFDAARQELDYCAQNRKYLKVPAAAYGRFEARLRSQINAEDIKEYLVSDGAKVEQLLARNELGPVPGMINGMSRRLETVKSDIDASEYDHFVATISRYATKHAQKEDSLVNLVLEASRVQGKNAGKYLMGTLLPGHGVGREKIAAVDQQLLAMAVSETEAESHRANSEFDVLAQEDSADGADMTAFADLRRKAKVIAKARIDSVRAVMEERARVALEDWRKKNGRLVKQEAHIVATMEKVRTEAQQSLLVLRKAYSLEEDALFKKYAGNPEKGNRKITEMRGKFVSSRANTVQQFRTRLLALETRYDHNKVRQTPRPDLSSHPELAAKLANLVPNVQSRDLFDYTFLKEHDIPPAAQIALSSQALAVLSDEERAQLVVEDIYRLLEENRTDLAYARFNRERDTLKQHVYHEAFDVLRVTVEQAHYFASDAF